MRSQAIERLLPTAFQRGVQPGSVLTALLAIMEDMHAPDEKLLAGLDELFGPYSTQERMVPFLSRWVTLEWLVGAEQATGETSLALPMGRVRDLIANGADLAKTRGTAAGLTNFLRIATGVDGFVIELSRSEPFHFTVRVPAAAESFLKIIRKILEMEKPAASTYEFGTLPVPAEQPT